MNGNFNYYELLGVKNDATKEEIKDAYKKQMKKWHPDINKSNEAVNISSRLNEAKEVLLDDEKRKDYDDYLNKKIKENYNRYTQMKKNSKDYDEAGYESEKVTKWQYLKDWLKYSKASNINKAFAFLGVLLESLFCFIIKCILIITAYVSFYLSYFIRSLYSLAYPILGVLAMLFIIMCLTDGVKQTIKNNPGSLTAIILIIAIYVLSYVLPYFSKTLLSPKTFDILYNKIDIALFKRCVGYKD